MPAQACILGQTSRAYVALNMPGVAVLAYVERQWRFLLLEAVWALVAANRLVARRSVEPAR